MAVEDEIYTDTDYRFVTVVDRVGTGGPIKLANGQSLPGEIVFGGQVFKIKPKFRLRGPVAIHVFRSLNQLTWVHDVEGNWVNRLAIDPGPDDDESLIQDLGPECLDTTPIDVDLDAVEHWDVGTMDPLRRETIKRRLRTQIGVPRSEMGSLETAGGRASFAKE